MKRCPECRRDYHDDTLSFCLADGAELVYGLGEEPATAILHQTGTGNEAATRAQIATAAYAKVDSGAVTHPHGASKRKSLVAGVIGMIVVSALGVGSYLYYGRGSGKQIDSIAVMPFANDSGNVDLEYLSDGMTETLIGSLSQIAGLNVKARSSVFRYKGTGTDARTIGKDLGVQAVLNGRLVQRGDQLTLALELIDAQNDNLIWSDKYERKSADLVSLQTEIARDVSSKLKLKLTNADQLKLAKRYTNDPEVYRLYLQGRYYWNKRSAPEVAKGIPFFQQSVEKDPNFALGYIGLADSDEDRDRPQKLEYIKQALAIDPDLAEAHASLGYQLMCKQDWLAAEREFTRAKQLSPNYALAYAWNGMHFTMIGKYDEALAEIDRALALEPTANGINFYKAVTLAVSGRHEVAMQHFKRIQQMDPSFSWAFSWPARIYVWNGDYASAVDARAHALEIDGITEPAARLRQAFASGGWQAFVAESKAQRVGGIIEFPPNDDAEKEKVIAQIQRQANNGTFWLFLMRVEPALDSLRGDPRFQEVLKRFDPPQ